MARFGEGGCLRNPTVRLNEIKSTSPVQERPFILLHD